MKVEGNHLKMQFHHAGEQELANDQSMGGKQPPTVEKKYTPIKKDNSDIIRPKLNSWLKGPETPSQMGILTKTKTCSI